MSDRFCESIIVDCPNCRASKVRHHCYYLIDKYRYTNHYDDHGNKHENFESFNNSYLHELSLDLLKSNSLSFDELSFLMNFLLMDFLLINNMLLK